MTDFAKIVKLPKGEQEGIIRASPEFAQVTKIIAKWQQAKEDQMLQELCRHHELVNKYALRRFMQQRQISKEEVEQILKVLQYY